MGGVREEMRERRGEEIGSMELKGRQGIKRGDGEGGRRGKWVGRKRKGRDVGKGQEMGERKKRGVGKREERMEGEMGREGG